MKDSVIAEIQGEYGPVAIEERLVQKVWAKGDFLRSGIHTLGGEPLEIIDVGEWNLLAGPDFRNACLKIGNSEIRGDVELHFYEEDWKSHGHEADPAYQNVILHVLVFPSQKRLSVADCHIPHTLVLLDLLPQGLEAYAQDEAIGLLSGQRETLLQEEFFKLTQEECYNIIHSKARSRWLAKVTYARQRIELLGWEGACHSTALEILGYRFNRTAMLRVAADYSLAAIREGDFGVDDLMSAAPGRWRTKGSRPANFPKKRLEQYLDWVGKVPEWPKLLLSVESGLRNGGILEISDQNRKSLRLADLKRAISKFVIADSLGGTRLETMICDGFLPLLSARNETDCFGHWFHWFSGDIPDVVSRFVGSIHFLKDSGMPMSNGIAQGILAILLEKTT